jgi:hypothetical protein
MSTMESGHVWLMSEMTVMASSLLMAPPSRRPARIASVELPSEFPGRQLSYQPASLS